METEWNTKAVEYVKLGLCDPVSCFIKNEPHPSRKADRLRVVNSLSIVDQLVERFLFSKLLQVLHDVYPHSGVLSGVGFTDDQSAVLCRLYSTICDNAPPGFSPYSEDVSGWDRTFSDERMQFVFKRLVEKADGPDWWKRSLLFWGKRLTRPVFVIQERKGYSIWVARYPGRMLSGSLVTTACNGVARLDSMYESGAISPFANGDDGVSLRADKQIESSVRLYKDYLGISVRAFEKHDRRGFAFCSHWFDCSRNVSYLTSWPKALFRLLTRFSTESTMEDFHREIRHHPDVEKLMLVADTYRHRPPCAPGEAKSSVEITRWQETETERKHPL